MNVIVLLYKFYVDEINRLEIIIIGVLNMVVVRIKFKIKNIFFFLKYLN